MSSTYLNIPAASSGAAAASYKWNDRVPTDSVNRENIYIDINSTSTTEDGTQANPYKTLAAGFATISENSASASVFARRVTVLVAPGTYGTSGVEVGVYVPAGRIINCIFMGPSAVYDTFIVKQDRSIAFSEPGNFTINGNVNATQAFSTHWKEFSRGQSSIFYRAITIINAQAAISRNVNIQMANIEFGFQSVVAEAAGAVDTSTSGAYAFWGANYMSGTSTINIWASNIATRYRDGTAGNSRSYILTYGPSVVIMDAKNCVFGDVTSIKGIIRTEDCIFDGNVTVTTAYNADTAFSQPLMGLYRTKFKSMQGNAVVFTGPANSFYCDKLTEKYSTGTNTVTFAGGAAITNRIGE